MSGDNELSLFSDIDLINVFDKFLNNQLNGVPEGTINAFSRISEEFNGIMKTNKFKTINQFIEFLLAHIDLCNQTILEILLEKIRGMQSDDKIDEINKKYFNLAKNFYSKHTPLSDLIDVNVDVE